MAVAGVGAADHAGGQKGSSQAGSAVVQLEDALNIVHTGDTVLLCCCRSDSSNAEAAYETRSTATRTGGTAGATGVVVAGEPSSGLHLVPFEFGGVDKDVRDSLFVVVPQLSYTAQRDLRRLRKHHSSATDRVAADEKIRLCTERAADEARENAAIVAHGLQRPVHYGHIVQLQHLRTRQFIGVNRKLSARQNKTARRVELQAGYQSCWFHLDPGFAHCMQGEEVTYEQEVHLQCQKLGERWHIHASSGLSEISCVKGGCSFNLKLYSRALPLEPGLPDVALGFGNLLRFFHAHHRGFMAASSAQTKSDPYLRRSYGAHRHARQLCAKDIWVPELMALDRATRDCGVEFSFTPVLLRHFSSGRYLAVSNVELLGRGVHEPTSDRLVTPSPSSRSFRVDHFASSGLSTEPLSAELVDAPGAAAIFTFETSSPERSEDQAAPKSRVPRQDARVMLRCDVAADIMGPLWLSCTGATKGGRTSLVLQWTDSRQSRDVFHLELVDSHSEALECEFIAAQRRILSNELLPRVLHSRSDPAAMVQACKEIERSLSNMVIFLTDADCWLHLQGDNAVPSNHELTDASATAQPERQRLVREMRYVEFTVTLCKELVRQTPSLHIVDFDQHGLNQAISRSATAINRSASGRLGSKSSPGTDSNQTAATEAKIRCLNLIVQLWLHSFRGSRDSVGYFHKRGWMETLDSLNGHGLGAPAVLVALLKDNPDIGRSMTAGTVARFIEFIRKLGPRQTWLAFLRTLCTTQGQALASRQQSLLSALYFGGSRASQAQRRAAQQNRTELLVWTRLDASIGVPLGNPSSGQGPPWEGCLARRVLQHGIHEIAISWAHTEQWVPGRGGLFHGPTALELPQLAANQDDGGRIWVPLVQVAWVLQPERCCEFATGKSLGEIGWTPDKTHAQQDTESQQLVSGDRFALRRVLAGYFLAQLQLIVVMVLQRQVNCILALQTEYSLSLCLSGAADVRLPTSIRATFFDLVTNMWLERHPHNEIAIPSIAWRLQTNGSSANATGSTSTPLRPSDWLPDSWSKEHAESLPEEARELHSMREPGRMEAVLQVVRGHLCTGPDVEQQIHSATDDAELMFAVLRILGSLLRLGFVRSRELVHEMMGPILRCLDGRTDWLDLLDATEAARHEKPAAQQNSSSEVTPLLEAGGHARSADSGATVSITGLPVALGGQLVKARFPLAHSSHQRWVGSLGNRAVFASKVQMAQVLRLLMRLGLDTKTAHIVQQCRAAQNDGCSTASSVASRLAKEVVLVADEPATLLERMRVRDPNAMLMDLLMYEDPELCTLALELLVTNCRRLEALLEHLDGVVLLSDAGQADLAASLQTEVNRLGRLIHSVENWGGNDEFSDTDLQQLAEMERICGRLSKLCNAGEGNIQPAVVQSMMRQTRFFAHLVHSMRLDPYDRIPSCAANVAAMASAVCSAAVYVVRGNTNNQAMALDVVPFATRLMGEQPEYALLLAEIFRDNAGLCQQVPEFVVNKVGELALRERRAGRWGPWYIAFFGAITAVGPTPVTRNRTMVLAFLQGQPPDAVLQLGDLSSFSRLQDMASAFIADDQLQNPVPAAWASVRAGDAELIYHVRSLEVLVTLALGRGSEALASKAYVGTLLPPTAVLRSLQELELPPHAQTAPSSVYYCLRTQWLRLLQLTAYNVDANLVDEELLMSPQHDEFLKELLRWIEEGLDLIPVNAAGKVEQGAEDMMCSEQWEKYLGALLGCMQHFLLGIYPVMQKRQGPDQIQELTSFARAAATFFMRLLPGSPQQQAPRRGLRDPELLYTLAFRVVAANSTNDPDTRALLSARGSQAWQQVARPQQRQQQQQQRDQRGEPESLNWQSVLEHIRSSECVQARLDKEEQMVSAAFRHVGESTDPEAPDYVKQLPISVSGALPDGVDFRRDKITVQMLLDRLVRHSHKCLNDVCTLQRVLRSFFTMFSGMGDDEAALCAFQIQFIRASVPRFILRVLSENPTREITFACWDLLGGMMRTASGHVDETVQAGIHKALLEVDDSSLWQSFLSILTIAGEGVKPTRTLNRYTFLTSEERAQVQEHSANLGRADTVMQVVSLMLEGHYKVMQDYIFEQAGKTRTVNVLNTAFWLMGKLCKGAEEADRANEQEFSCLASALHLLTEGTGGPNLRIQEFLSTLGHVAAVFRLVESSFAQMQRASGDLYPTMVRKLKAQLLESVLVLLEGRLDTKIHEATLQRIDRVVLRERIVFVYLYFIFGAYGVASGEVRSEAMASVPLNGRMQRWLLPTVEPSELYGQVTSVASVASEVLEDLDDLELDILFSEGLDCIQLILELSPHSPEFERDIKPLTADQERFIDDEAMFPTKGEFVRERKAYHRREVYRMSFEFLQSFVLTIEVLLHDKLQNLHFQQPLTARWYCSDASKQKILDTVPFASLDAKVKAFVQMCEELHRECRLIRRLSRFSILPDKQRKWAQRYLPDGLHRPFNNFLAADARGMQRLLHVALFLSLALAWHGGWRLVPGKQGQGRAVVWIDDVAKHIGLILASVYFCCTLLWMALFACIKVPLNIQVKRLQRPTYRNYQTYTLALLAFVGDGNVLWRLLLLVLCAVAVLCHHPWLLCLLVTDFFCQNATLATVLSGVVAPASFLVMTFFGMIIVTFVYAAVGFHSFQADFGDYCSSNIMVCTLNIIYQGTRNGIIGLSSMMTETGLEDPGGPGRMVYDVSYFLVFGVMLLNAVVGLVVNSFSALRAETVAREHNYQTQTFISGLERRIIETAAQQAGISNGFDYHEETKQNKWDYMAFIFHLREKDAEEYTGPETAILKKVKQGDVSWLPMGRSSLLEADKTYGGEDTLSRIEREARGARRDLKALGQGQQQLQGALRSLSRRVDEGVERVQAVLTPYEQEATGLNIFRPVVSAGSSPERIQQISSDQPAVARPSPSGRQTKVSFGPTTQYTPE